MGRLAGEPIEREQRIRADVFRSWHIGRRTILTREGTHHDGEITRCVVTHGTEVIRDEHGNPSHVDSTVDVYLSGVLGPWTLSGDDTIVFTDGR